MNLDDASYENRLGDALEQLLADGADDLDALAAGLAKLGVPMRDNGSWTAERLRVELQRLAAETGDK
jgi:hypothetical protein